MLMWQIAAGILLASTIAGVLSWIVALFFNATFRAVAGLLLVLLLLAGLRYAAVITGDSTFDIVLALLAIGALTGLLEGVWPKLAKSSRP